MDMTQIGYERLLLTAVFAIAAVTALFGALFGRSFRFTLLGSHKLGPKMPKWFARPFFFMLGMFFLWGAFAVWTGKVALDR